ncbi:MAG: SMP-30/gluconolactonase/LRE family protein [Planctomycetes bacterium]|nr:SMP-30/gluconolactonase/LRE family protein [Planctomycetota bacterium]
MNDIECVATVHDEVGETPMWIPEEKALYWIDVEGPRVHRLETATGAVKTFALDFPITALARRASGGWIAAAKTGLYFWDHRTNASSFIVDPEAAHPDLRPNDAAVDRQGRFLIGTMNQKDLAAPDGSLYQLSPEGALRRLGTGLAVANGIALSPNGRTLYVTDMFHSRILAYDYDTATGDVGGRREFAAVPADAGLPDGLIVDAQGFIWSAHWGGWLLTRYDPDGRIDRQIRMPVANPTCMAFGGARLDELYVTTAWFMLSPEERKAQPEAGNLFRLWPGVTGLVEPAFAG